MSGFEIECSECGWQCKKIDLLNLNDDTKEGPYCPDCGNKEIKDFKK